MTEGGNCVRCFTRIDRWWFWIQRAWPFIWQLVDGWTNVGIETCTGGRDVIVWGGRVVGVGIGKVIWGGWQLGKEEAFSKAWEPESVNIASSHWCRFTGHPPRAWQWVAQAWQKHMRLTWCLAHPNMAHRPWISSAACCCELVLAKRVSCGLAG